MEKINLGGHQCGVLKLTRRAVIAPFERVFGMKIVDCQGEEQKNEQKSEVELLSARLSHRIP
jgi:hypothetical protein